MGEEVRQAWSEGEISASSLPRKKKLPEGPARDKVRASPSLFSEVAAKLGEKLKDLASVVAT